MNSFVPESGGLGASILGLTFGAETIKYFRVNYDSTLDLDQVNQSCDKFLLLLLVNSSIESNSTLKFFIGSGIGCGELFCIRDHLSLMRFYLSRKLLHPSRAAAEKPKTHNEDTSVKEIDS